jgi:predicted transcriptional regulator
MDLQNRASKKIHNGFGFRLRIGDYEVEITGACDDVLNTIRDLPNLVCNIDKAFEKLKPRKVATLTVKTESTEAQKRSSQQYPQIPPAEELDKGIVKLLETSWGKWRPRTIEELSEALKSNGMQHSTRTLASVLTELVKKEKIRRWNTNAGNVYILAEKEALHSREESE